jgi:hypothetical protein
VFFSVSAGNQYAGKRLGASKKGPQDRSLDTSNLSARYWTSFGSMRLMPSDAVRKVGLSAEAVEKELQENPSLFDRPDDTRTILSLS